MPCLSGMGSLGASAVDAASMGYHNYDGPGLLSAVFFGVRGNTVAQKFDRKFSKIDYKIQKQQLHREDIRDLVDLTTARMDIYHIVGTLLLAFCMTWYTDNALIDSPLPAWFADIFLISNFSAVAYLLLCVWLAMYAAIAARSSGVRLLTSYARISFPTDSQIEKIKVPIFFNSLDYLRQTYKARFGTSEEPVSANEDIVPRGRGIGNQDENPDDEQHFRKFLEVLPTWLVYDTYSRVCMTLGMNQMLQALSYYILGVIWTVSPMVAIMSFFGVQLLGYIVLWLDVGSLNEYWSDVFAFWVLSEFPPVLALLILLNQSEVPTGTSNVDNLAIAATLCFLAHAGWLWYLTRLFRNAGREASRFKPGEFAFVLEWVKGKKTRKDMVDNVLKACQDLDTAMQEVEKIENETKEASFTQRTAALELLHANASKAYSILEDHLTHTAQHIDDISTEPAGRRKASAENPSKRDSNHHPAGEAALDHATRTFERVAIWERAPALLAAIEALKHPMLQEALSRSEKRTVEDIHSRFVKQCWTLNLGICALSPKQNDRVIALSTAAGERYTVRTTSGDKEVWIDTADGSVSSSPPPASGSPLGNRVTTYEEVVNRVFPEWNQAVDKLRNQPKELALPEINGGTIPGRWDTSANATKTALVEKTEWVPTKMIRWLTVSIIIWWIVAGFAHALACVFRSDDTVKFTGDESFKNYSIAAIQWPQPARLFKVASLNCNDSHVWVSNGFSEYSAGHVQGSNTLGELTRMSSGRVGVAICGARHCDSLRPPIENGPWMLSSLGAAHQPGPAEAKKVPVPHSWRVVSGVWTNCPKASSGRCDAGWLAGWDGARVVTATLKIASSGNWEVDPQFEVDPAIGLCAGGKAGCVKTDSPPKYDDVKALQLGRGGRTLLVLLGDGIVDAWDLSKGIVMKRWHLGAEYTSMCHSDKRMFLALHNSAGPLMVSMGLPHMLTELLESGSVPSLRQQTVEQSLPPLQHFESLTPDGLSSYLRGRKAYSRHFRKRPEQF